MSDVSKVMILYTGGTIGMKITPRGYAPAKGYLQKQLRSMPQFHDPSQPELTTPPSRLGRRVCYQIKEYEPLLDSSNMEYSDWVEIAEDIERHYDDYDAFIVLHGTDTMAYGTSALSFMLVNLAKPVIVTGSQLPLSEIRNDAVENLLGALALAGQYNIPEVGLYFRSQLFRGNRVRKVDASAFDAFASGDFPPLARVGVDCLGTVVFSSYCFSESFASRFYHRKECGYIAYFSGDAGRFVAKCAAKSRFRVSFWKHLVQVMHQIIDQNY